MADLEITAAFWDYDRTLPIIRGQVPIEGCSVRCLVLPPQDIFFRAFATAEFGISELSLSRHAQAVANGTSAYLGLPVFLSRTFRHASLYVHCDRGIDRPQDLRGKRIGLNNYDDTAAVVVRGFLRDIYGLKLDDITWVIGDFDRSRRKEILRPTLTRGVPLETSAVGDTLDQQLAEGRIDGLIGLTPPPSFLKVGSDIRRLFPDWRRAEKDYYEQTRIFPIMHLVGVRRDLSDANPWLSTDVFAAFSSAKDMAMKDLAMLQSPKSSLPWLVAEFEDTRKIMGDDFWPYGVEANRHTLETTLRHLHEDGLLVRELRVDEIFA